MTLLEALDRVAAEYHRGVSIHGGWQNYSLEQMMAVIINELVMEAGSAEAAGNIDGEHGVINELEQVSACCTKAVMVLSCRSGVTV